jgi:hypothetical protein
MEVSSQLRVSAFLMYGDEHHQIIWDVLYCHVYGGTRDENNGF